MKQLLMAIDMTDYDGLIITPRPKMDIGDFRVEYDGVHIPIAFSFFSEGTVATREGDEEMRSAAKQRSNRIRAAGPICGLMCAVVGLAALIGSGCATTPEPKTIPLPERPSGGTGPHERDWPHAIAALLGVDADGIDGSSSGATDAILAPVVVLGPGFFRQYMRLPALKQIGTATQFRMPLGTPPKVSTFEGRMLLGPSRASLLTVPELRAVLAQYREGRLRQATPKERAIFYALIPFEIEGRPVYVVESSEGRLLVDLDDGKRVSWIEYLDQWQIGND